MGIVYKGISCNLRFVEKPDAADILCLRLNPRLNAYISSTSRALEAQENWIDDYKKRESLEQEYYFAVLDPTNEFIGTMRIYSIDRAAGRFTGGSWIMKPGCTFLASVEALLAGYSFGFDYLGLEENQFDVRKDNRSVRSFHERMGALAIGEDEQNVYFSISKTAFNEYLARIRRQIALPRFKKGSPSSLQERNGKDIHVPNKRRCPRLSYRDRVGQGSPV